MHYSQWWLLLTKMAEKKNVRNEEPAFLATAITEGRTSLRKRLKMQLGLNN